MTREEFMEKYGNAKVKFSSYYKFSFVFSGELPDGKRISVIVGGNADDIYRMEVDVNAEETVAPLYPHSGDVWDKGVAVESFYDY